jgi:K+-transporting ATPase ATPase C chain
MFIREIRRSVIVLAILTIVTGVLYPLTVTVIAWLAFPSEAGGSLLSRGGTVVGSRLIGQSFTSPGYFWGRPSAAGASGCDAAASSGSNDGPLSPALQDRVKRRIADLRTAGNDAILPVPVDLVTASGSGLDPHISIAAARYQVARVARARGIAGERVTELVDRHTEGRQFGFLGEPRVNVLLLNIALDSLANPTGAGQ